MCWCTPPRVSMAKAPRQSLYPAARRRTSISTIPTRSLPGYLHLSAAVDTAFAVDQSVLLIGTPACAFLFRHAGLPIHCRFQFKRCAGNATQHDCDRLHEFVSIRRHPRMPQEFVQLSVLFFDGPNEPPASVLLTMDC